MALNKGYNPPAGEKDTGRLADAIRQIHQNAAGQAAVDALDTRVTALEDAPTPSGGMAAAGGRLSLTSGLPVMTSTVSGATTVYYVPYLHRFVPLYDGSAVSLVDIGGQLSQATTDDTKSPAVVTTNSNYDLFVWDDDGTYRCTRGPAWSSATDRGTGAGTTEITRVQGLVVNANAITNGPAANRGTYVGTVRTNGSSQVDWTLGSSAAGGGAAVLGVWNFYNRVDVITEVTDSTATWTYATATIRAANNSTSNRVSFVIGSPEDAILATHVALPAAATVGALGRAGMALDATNALNKRGTFICPTNATFVVNSFAVSHAYAPQTGFHFIQATEIGDGSNTITWNGGDNQCLIVKLRM